MLTSTMREVCIDCGTSWGVTMTPREVVRCTPCATPRPWKWPLRYWQARVWNFRPDRYATYRSPEWWDAQTSRKDLAVAIEFAHELPQECGS
jgi:hypothetical protein